MFIVLSSKLYAVNKHYNYKQTKQQYFISESYVAYTFYNCFLRRDSHCTNVLISIV